MEQEQKIIIPEKPNWICWTNDVWESNWKFWSEEKREEMKQEMEDKKDFVIGHGTNLY